MEPTCRFEIKCKMTADVWAISGYEKSEVPTFYCPVRTCTLHDQTSCFIIEVVEQILYNDFSTRIRVNKNDVLRNIGSRSLDPILSIFLKTLHSLTIVHNYTVL